jgi:FtsP/CotA-like multicopper oxidase with cupredoxin domain
VGGVTECPIAPGHSTTYFFQATQFGTSWYHSHHGVQYGDGLLGPLVINGPASSNYDTDLGPLTMNDYYYQTATNGDLEYFRFISDPTFSSPNPTPDNILLNGTNMNAAGTAGKYLKVQLTKGKRHLLRLINASVDSALTVSLDGHNLTIVTSDFVPVQPLTVSSLMINIGQRYEVIIEANQTPGNYWFRAQTQTACASVNNNPNGGLGIFSYAGVKVANPTTTSSITDPGCNEPSPLVPYVVNTVGSSSDFIAQSKELDIDFPVEGVSSNGQNILQWGVNMSALDVSWDKPTMSYLIEGNNSFPITENLIEIANEGIWTFWVVQEVGFAATPHPIHLHGHDFYILGRGAGAFDYENGPASLQYNNPTRRDVATLPSGGWMVMAFMTDNPGYVFLL